jgi:hypothetical protein
MATVPQAIRIWEGNSTQQGATWDGLGVNFSLFSANATKVELCLFDQNGTQEIQRIELPEYTDEIWHGYLPTAGTGPFLCLGEKIQGLLSFVAIASFAVVSRILPSRPCQKRRLTEPFFNNLAKARPRPLTSP